VNQPAKFWQPLPFWQVIVAFVLTQLACVFGVVALREGLGLGVPVWVGSGLGGMLGVVVVSALAKRRREEVGNR
jgi:hypothetical protein